MSRVCIISPADHELRDVVATTLSNLGCDIVAESEVCDGAAELDCLVCLTGEDESHDLTIRWLGLINHARTDMLLTTTGRRVLPARTTIWIRDGRNLGPRIQRAVEGLQEGRAETGTNGLEIPRLLAVPDDTPGESVVDSWAGLRDRLRDETQKVIGVWERVFRELAKGRAESRAEYDVARFVRWSQDRLDQSFVKLTMRLAGGESVSGGVATDVTSLAQVLSDTRTSNLILIRGAPGAGKSLQLRFLETTYALESIRKGSLGDAPLPFCVALGEHATSGAADPLDWLNARWAKRVAVEQMQVFRRKLEEGNMRLFLDGFNEIPFVSAADRRDWMLKWRSLIHDELLQNPTNAVVLACRTRDLSVPMATAERPQTLAEMLPLSNADINEIAERRNPRAAHELRSAIARDPGLAELYRTPFTLSVYLDDDTPGVPRSQSEVFARRIRSALQHEREQLNVRLFDERWLPENAVTTVLEDARAPLGSLPLIKALGRLAHDLTQAGVSGAQSHSSLDLADAEAQMGLYLALKDDGARQEAIFAAVELDLLRNNEGVVSFRHHSFQEFFAANTLSVDELGIAIAVASHDFARRLGTLKVVMADLGPGDELPVLPSTGFEEVAAKACELKASLIPILADSNPWLAAELVARSPAHAPVGDDVARLVRDALRARLDQADDVRERIATLDAIGRISHPARDEEDALARIPEGVWEFGCDRALSEVLASARRRRTVSMAAFDIGLTAVTNSEYRRFVEDGGYERRDLWTLEGWGWKTGTLPLDGAVTLWRARRDAVIAQPSLPIELLRHGRVSLAEAAAVVRFADMSDEELEQIVARYFGDAVMKPAFWDSERFASPFQPVVGVSWYEADAYCRWLSLEQSRGFRLPTEDEWEAAALHVLSQCGHALKVADGTVKTDDVWPPEAWSEIWGNTAELHLGRTAAVGAFIDPRSADWALPMDLFGNVFEWSVDTFRPGEDTRRTCKGGSWRHLMRRAMPGYRGRGDLATRNDDDGFRIVAESEEATYGS